MRPREERSPYWSGGIRLAMLVGIDVIASERGEGSGREVAGTVRLSDHMDSEVEVGVRVEFVEEMESWMRGEALLEDDIEDMLEAGADEPHKFLEWVLWRIDLGRCTYGS